MFDPDTQQQLARYGFDQATFERLRQALKEGRFAAERNRVTEPVALPGPDDLMLWPQTARGALDPGHRAAAQMQQAAARLAAGQVAVAILNGGMATRFGGRVKGVVTACAGQSFLALKLRQAHQAAPKAHLFLMNSFATAAATAAHLQEHDHFGVPPAQVHLIEQNISLRLTSDGQLFVDAQGQPSFYAPGHGDLLGALSASADFARLAQAHRPLHVMVSNVDNLGATVDATVLAAHLAGARPITCEVAQRRPHDAGGAPLHYRGRLQILEEFRFPSGFDARSCPVFNTNTFVLDSDIVHGRHPFSWFRADKQVDGRAAVQFERLIGEVTAFADATFLQVPREGATSRFLPVKAPPDLEQIQPAIAARFGL